MNAQVILLIAGFTGAMALLLGLRHCSGRWSDASPFFGTMLLVVAAMCGLLVLGCVIALHQAKNNQPHSSQAVSHTGLKMEALLF